jgi:hypothetical protein
MSNAATGATKLHSEGQRTETHFICSTTHAVESKQYKHNQSEQGERHHTLHSGFHMD